MAKNNFTLNDSRFVRIQKLDQQNKYLSKKVETLEENVNEFDEFKVKKNNFNIKCAMNK